MNVEIKWTWSEKYPRFNVILSNPGKEPFLEIKGCRIANGKNGQFVSPPSTPDKDGKYWNHAYLSKDFGAIVLKKALESQPDNAVETKRSNPPAEHEDVPFSNPYKAAWRSI